MAKVHKMREEFMPPDGLYVHRTLMECGAVAPNLKSNREVDVTCGRCLRVMRAKKRRGVE